MFRYPEPYAIMSIFDPATTQFSNSPGYILQTGGNPALNTMNTLLINYSGPIGATALLVILACALYLTVRKTIAWRIPLSAAICLGAIAFVFPRSMTDGLHSAAYELMSGIFVFAVVFMASDPVTSPKGKWAQVLFGAFIGAGTMLVRYVGFYGNVGCFPSAACKCSGSVNGTCWLENFGSFCFARSGAG